MRNPGEFQEPNFQDSSFPRTDDNSSVSSATSATSVPSSDNSKKPDTNRWIKPQTDMLVSLWQENTGVLKSTRSHKMCVKIKAAVDNLGPAKTIKHCKDKMRKHKKTGAAPSFPPYCTQIDEIPGCRDVMCLPEKNRSWCKLHFRRRNLIERGYR